MSSNAPVPADGPVFFQFADLRLGCPADPRLRLSAEKLAVRAAEQREVFRRLCAAAAEAKAEAVFVPGDLLDGPVPEPDDFALIAEGFAALAPATVFLCPGDRDAYRPDSVYNRNLPAFADKPLPANVHVFTGPAYETLRPPGMDGVTVTGRSHPAALNPTGRPLAKRIPRTAGGISVLLHHGTPYSLRNACREPTEVFTDAELLGQDFSYVAVGHSGRSFLLRDPAGAVRAADAGAAAALGRPSQSRPAALTGRLGPGGVAPDSLRPMRFDPRGVFEVKADLSGAAATAEIAARIRSAAAASGATEQDMVYVSALGLYSSRAEPPPAGEFADLKYFHFRVDYSAARPDFDLENLRDEGRPRPTVERRFTASLMEQIEKSGDDAQRELLENALYCGLEALRTGRTEYRG
jgi:hypothetical protein